MLIGANRSKLWRWLEKTHECYDLKVPVRLSDDGTYEAIHLSKTVDHIDWPRGRKLTNIEIIFAAKRISVCENNGKFIVE